MSVGIFSGSPSTWPAQCYRIDRLANRAPANPRILCRNGASAGTRHRRNLLQDPQPNLFLRRSVFRQHGAVLDASLVGTAGIVTDNFHAGLVRAQRSPRPGSKIRRGLPSIPQQDLLLNYQFPARVTTRPYFCVEGFLCWVNAPNLN